MKAPLRGGSSSEVKLELLGHRSPLKLIWSQPLPLCLLPRCHRRAAFLCCNLHLDAPSHHGSRNGGAKGLNPMKPWVEISSSSLKSFLKTLMDPMAFYKRQEKSQCWECGAEVLAGGEEGEAHASQRWWSSCLTTLPRDVKTCICQTRRILHYEEWSSMQTFHTPPGRSSIAASCVAGMQTGVWEASDLAHAGNSLPGDGGGTACWAKDLWESASLED